MRDVEEFDIRIKRLRDNPRYILINNYKCGFSSSGELAYDKVTRISPQDQVILFYRNIFARAISVFINWCISEERHLHEKDWLLRNLKRELSTPDYQGFLGLLRVHRYTDAFRVYVNALTMVCRMDNHTLPQVALLEYYHIDKVDHFVELENSAAFMAITNIPFPYDYSNQSDVLIKQSLQRCLRADESLQRRLRRIYQKDLAYFAGHGLDCGSW